MSDAPWFQDPPAPWRRYWRLRKLGWPMMHAREYVDHLTRTGC